MLGTGVGLADGALVREMLGTGVGLADGALVDGTLGTEVRRIVGLVLGGVLDGLKLGLKVGLLIPTTQIPSSFLGCRHCGWSAIVKSQNAPGSQHFDSEVHVCFKFSRQPDVA